MLPTGDYRNSVSNTLFKSTKVPFTPTAIPGDMVKVIMAIGYLFQEKNSGRTRGACWRPSPW